MPRKNFHPDVETKSEIDVQLGIYKGTINDFIINLISIFHIFHLIPQLKPNTVVPLQIVVNLQ